ncbi:tail completion protein gp17 [Caulobacter segnis]
MYATAPRLPTYPCVVVTRSEGRPVSEGDAIEHLLTLTCASRFGAGRRRRGPWSRPRRAALHDARPALIGRRLVSLRVRLCRLFRRAPTARPPLGIVRVRAVTKPSRPGDRPWPPKPARTCC